MDPTSRGSRARARATRASRAIRRATPSALAARAVLDGAAASALPRDTGIALTVQKGLPLSGGQGGSAASAVAGAVAANALLGAPLDRARPAGCCLVAEETVAGRHLDNIAPSLLGGIVLIRCMDPPDVVQLPVPDELHRGPGATRAAMRTADARAVLPATVPRDVALHQAAQVGAIVAALASGTTRCSAARSTTGSPSRPARAFSRGSRGEGGRARGRRARQLDLGQRPHGVRARPAVARRPSGWRRRWWRRSRRRAIRAAARVRRWIGWGARLIESTGGTR